mmetsp:Transcript_832/g.2625  ORF Transcript_832/g.2625 Transcript_832/m.2625 type:complete len:432 (+) Transcript_832:192-1487(+)
MHLPLLRAVALHGLVGLDGLRVCAQHVVHEQAGEDHRDERPEDRATQAVYQAQVVQRSTQERHQGQPADGGRDKVPLPLRKQADGRERRVPQRGEGEREAEEHSEADGDARGRGARVAVRVVVEDVPLAMLPEAEVADDHHPTVNRQRDAEGVRDRPAEPLRGPAAHLHVELWGVVVCDEGCGERREQHERRHRGRVQLGPVDFAEVNSVLRFDGGVILANGTVAAVQEPPLHERGHEHLATNTEQRGVRKRGEVPLEAERRQDAHDDEHQDGLLGGEPTLKAEEVQDPGIRPAEHHRIGHTSEARLDHQRHSHGLRENWPAHQHPALLVGFGTGVVADAAHHAEGAAEQEAEGGGDQAAGHEAGARGDAGGQAQHPFPHDVLDDVEHSLGHRRPVDVVVELVSLRDRFGGLFGVAADFLGLLRRRRSRLD